MTWEQVMQLAAAMQHYGWEVRAVSPLVKPSASGVSGASGYGYRETTLYTARGWRIEATRRGSGGGWVFLNINSVADWQRWLVSRRGA